MAFGGGDPKPLPAPISETDQSASRSAQRAAQARRRGRQATLLAGGDMQEGAPSLQSSASQEVVNRSLL